MYATILQIHFGQSIPDAASFILLKDWRQSVVSLPFTITGIFFFETQKFLAFVYVNETLNIG